MRKPIIAGNWKMNCLLSEAVALVGELRSTAGWDANSGVDVLGLSAIYGSYNRSSAAGGKRNRDGRPEFVLEGERRLHRADISRNAARCWLRVRYRRSFGTARPVWRAGTGLHQRYPELLWR